MRPEGWDETYEAYREEHKAISQSAILIYEAGADAMLEGLKKEGQFVDRKHTVTNNWNSETLHQFDKGYLVFIPETEEG